MSEVVYRTYEQGDESGIADLFERCFGHALSTEHWEWKYTKNPYGNYYIMVAVSEGRVVAHYGGYPVYMEDSRGQKVRAIHVGDIMTDPKVRGSGIGRRSVIARVTQAFYREFCVGKVRFNFGVPSSGHMRLGQIIMSYQSAGRVLLWTREGDGVPRSRWRRHLCSLKAWQYKIRQSGSIEPDVEQLYHRIKESLGVSLCRDDAYLQWRYRMPPLKDYRFYRITRGKRLALWAVVSREENNIFLGDILVDPDESFLFSLLVEEMSRCWPGMSLHLWAFASLRWWVRVLTKAGFTQMPHPSGIIAGLTIFDEEDYSAERMKKDWFYAMGDFDLF